MGTRNEIVVEVFDKERFVGWFPESSFSQAIRRIDAFERGATIGNLKCSYMIFQGGGGKFHRYNGDKGYSFVGAINLQKKLASHEFLI